MTINKRDFELFTKVSDAAANQISESRRFFEKMYKVTLSAMLVIAAVGIALFFIFFGQKYDEIERTATKKTDEQVKDMQVKVQQQLDEQLKDMQVKVQQRLEEEFKTEKMQATIRSIAQDQTKSGLSTVINQAVGDQVRTAIKAEGPRIQQTVIQETKKSVSELAPTIDKVVKDKSAEAEERIRKSVAQSEEILRAGNLAILARNGSGEAYDKLMILRATTANVDIRNIASSAEDQAFLDMNQAFYSTREFIDGKKRTAEELIASIDATDALVRKAAIDTLVAQKNKSIIPKLLERAERDSYMFVRHAAYFGLRSLTGERIDALRLDLWKAWWEKNKGTWQSK